MLLDMEKELNKQKNEEKKFDDDENTDNHIEKEFHELSREERLQELTNLNESSSKDWKGLKSLTGANASGWKFEDSFYGNFNVGRRPSMDTAWGRRVYDQVSTWYVCTGNTTEVKISIFSQYTIVNTYLK